MKISSLVLIFCMFGCTGKIPTESLTSRCKREDRFYLDSLQNKDIKVPLKEVLSQARSFDWVELEHWMFPVFEQGTRFDKIMVGNCKKGDLQVKVYLAVSVIDDSSFLVKRVRVEERGKQRGSVVSDSFKGFF